MRVAIKIAYDGRAFYGHQRQPDRRTVEGECIAALRSSKIIRSAKDAFFRSASRTDRGVSALGNVIAFDTSLDLDAVLGAFNDRARGVWAWSASNVPPGFHPRHATRRWYRYFLLSDVAASELRKAGEPFIGTHDFRAFSSEPVTAPRTIERVDVLADDGMTLVDVRAPSFLRGMVRRIVAAMLAYARGDVRLDDLHRALLGQMRDFGMVPPEPLVLMDVEYDLPFRTILKPKVRDEWREAMADLQLRTRFFDELNRLAPFSGSA
jgi:tRNA pseudouridine38-40 synthase